MLDVEKYKLTWIDFVILPLFAITFFITMDYSITFGIAVLGMFVCFIIDGVITSWNNNKFFLKIRKYGLRMFIFLGFLVAMDWILTWISVIHLKIAYETNELVVYLWGTYGVLMGDIIFGGLLMAVYFIPVFLMIRSKNRLANILSFGLLIMYNIVFIYVVIHNAQVLYSGVCT